MSVAIMADITLDTLRLFVNERLSAVAEDILAVFVRTMFQYQQEIDIQRSQLDSLNLNPDIKPHVSDFFPVCKKDASPDEQQDGGPSLAQKEEPKITEELEELLQWPEQGDMLTMTLQAVKTDEEIHDGETEHAKPQVVVEYCGASQPSSHVQPLSLHCSDSDTEDSDEWEETRESLLNAQKSPETYVVETLPLNNLSRDLKSSKQQTPLGRNAKRLRHVCTHCGRRFPRSATLKVHMSVHSTDKPLSCQFCGKTFALKLHLMGHMRHVHKVQKAFSCKVCSEEFTHSGLKAHMKTHTPEKTFKKKEKKPFSCIVCGKKYARNVHMTRHMRYHVIVKPENAELNVKAENAELNVKAENAELNVKAENAELNVKAENAESSCTVCGKEFAQSGHLKVHMLTHTGDKPFKCTICGRGFNVRKNLARHTWTHTRDKPFHCTVCGKGYVEMCDLRKHLRRSDCGSGYGVQVYATNT